MLTWQQLRDLQLTGLQHAADGWGTASRHADAARDRLSNDMLGALAKSQISNAADSAATRLRGLDRNYDYIHIECGLVRTSIDALCYELADPQRKLRDALDEAATLKFNVAGDGSVSYPPGGENLMSKQPLPGGTVAGGSPLLSRPPSLTQTPSGFIDTNPNRAKAQAIADQISDALRDAHRIDDLFSRTLSKLKAEPGLSVATATWEDMATDATAVREVADHYLKNDIPTDKTPAERKAWWSYLTEKEREEYLATYPDILGNLDGIPSVVRDEANRDNLQVLIGKLAAEENDSDAQAKLGGLRSLDDQLRATPTDGAPPMYLLGIGEEGNGRAIVAFGNPDTSKNVSAYVPGLSTALNAEFAGGTVDRARRTAIGAREIDSSSAAIVWLGYDAPQTDNADVMSRGDAEAGAPAYNQFMSGISVTNENADPHITAIGHSYGSLTVGLAAQHRGGIPGVDDIILVGSPGTGAHTADELGVGRDHVYVGAAKNDIVTQLPNRTEATGLLVGAAVGLEAGFMQGNLDGVISVAEGGLRAGHNMSDPNETYFGTDPANHAFGAHRFATADGPPVIGWGHLGDLGAHSGYFTPAQDKVSARNIALIVAGHPADITTQEPR
ncbi:alpha/beta hydrolase [Streptomyces sp. NBC_00083]|uniref:alpha/beta hydrolase n=1 Tax=Streptomyces sp. NBC_00083 TaxID=2975647 RepID=UPI00224DF2BE|nr:alpha/beta hydrolase [Streptomyces sp. NBC_00083]MCX5387884.1 alpha/beta hydrolase family protein [Streptomyces sp. NBC_00083]